MRIFRKLLNHLSTHIHRVCLGKNFAEASIFLNIASALHIFRITPPLDAEGHYQKVGVTMSTGFLS